MKNYQKFITEQQTNDTNKFYWFKQSFDDFLDYMVSNRVTSPFLISDDTTEEKYLKKYDDKYGLPVTIYLVKEAIVKYIKTNHLSKDLETPDKQAPKEQINSSLKTRYINILLQEKDEEDDDDETADVSDLSKAPADEGDVPPEKETDEDTEDETDGEPNEDEDELKEPVPDDTPDDITAGKQLPSDIVIDRNSWRLDSSSIDHIDIDIEALDENSTLDAVFESIRRKLGLKDIKSEDYRKKIKAAFLQAVDDFKDEKDLTINIVGE